MKTKPFILFLEDVPADFVLVKRALSEGGLVFDAKQVETKDAFLKELQDHPPDLVLSDHGLDEFDAFSALALTKQRMPGVPFIFVTGSLGEEATSQALRSGAADFVLKEKLVDLLPAVRRALGITNENGRPAQSEEVTKLRQLNSELEQRVAQRTAQWEAAQKELDAFSYSVSHDLRAPLRHIDGFVELLRQSLGDKLEPANLEYLRVISSSTRLMGRLIDGLLAFSRLGRAPMHRAPIDMAGLVQAVLHELRFDTEGRMVEWVIGELPEVFGDATLLRQALLGLLSNALKYTRTRSAARIEIGSTSNEQETVFFIRDNGIGFAMQYAGKLFGVFQRLHAASEFEGIGIGLANVRRVIQRHGGRTWAEAGLDQGATFYFSLPKTAEQEPR